MWKLVNALAQTPISSEPVQLLKVS